jgi:hypothetical protein
LESIAIRRKRDRIVAYVPESEPEG